MSKKQQIFLYIFYALAVYALPIIEHKYEFLDEPSKFDFKSMLPNKLSFFSLVSSYRNCIYSSEIIVLVLFAIAILHLLIPIRFIQKRGTNIAAFLLIISVLTVCFTFLANYKHFGYHFIFIADDKDTITFRIEFIFVLIYWGYLIGIGLKHILASRENKNQISNE